MSAHKKNNFSWDLYIQFMAVFYHVILSFVIPMILLLIFVLIWPLLLIYAIWLLYDWDSPQKGGHASKWWRTMSIHRYFVQYFPVRLHNTTEFVKEKNYLIAAHPHGIMSMGTYANFCTNGTNVMDKFPGMKIRICTLVGHLCMPFRREWAMLHGLVNCSRESLHYLLDESRNKGNIVVLVVGGAEEALEARPGHNVLTLRHRKGFIKVALQTGAQLVPMYSFGENNLFYQARNPKGSSLRKAQNFFKKMTGVSPALYYGSFFFWPRKVPIDTVIGKPIDVKRIANPSEEQINELHRKYISRLIDLFESNKTKFGLHEYDHLIIE
uniref:Acyltransferase n=1 Tax=Ascaris suum TaxID=6253 RepID=F1L9C7_ASCSU